MINEAHSSQNGSLRLPPEILVEIFSRCLPPDRIRLSMQPQLLPPISLSRVCSLWRKLILATPRLWSRIVLGRYETDSAKEMAMFDAFSSRAGSSEVVPLDILLIPRLNDGLQAMLNQETNARYERDTSVLIEKFCVNALRLRTLVLSVLDADVLHPLFRILSVEEAPQTPIAPSLEELRISMMNLNTSGGPRILNHLARTCPNLRSVSLMAPPILPGTSSADESPIMHSMRTLDLRFCTSLSHAMDWINVCPGLEMLKVQLFWPPDHDEDADIDGFEGLDDEERDESDGLEDGGWVLINNTRPRPNPSAPRSGNVQKEPNRNLSRLKRLEMHSLSSPGAVGAVLDTLTTPALKALKVSCSLSSIGPGNAWWLPVPYLLQRSEASLEELQVFGTPMNVDNIRTCLRLSPKLKKLTLGMFEELDILVKELTVPKSFPTPEDEHHGSEDSSEREILCPELEVFDIADSVVAVDALAAMLLSRFSNESEFSSTGMSRLRHSLKELCVANNTAENVIGHPDIAVLISKGLKVTEREPSILLSLQVD